MLVHNVRGHRGSPRKWSGSWSEVSWSHVGAYFWLRQELKEWQSLSVCPFDDMLRTKISIGSVSGLFRRSLSAYYVWQTEPTTLRLVTFTLPVIPALGGGPSIRWATLTVTGGLHSQGEILIEANREYCHSLGAEVTPGEAQFCCETYRISCH